MTTATSAASDDHDDDETRAFSELLRAFQRGDRAAGAALYDRFGWYVLEVIRRRLSPPLRSRFDTMDLSQSVFAEVLRDISRFEDHGPGAFARWLEIKSESKVSEKLRQTLGRDGGRKEEDVPDGEEPPALGSGPDEVVAVRERAARVAQRLAALDDVAREIIRLRWEEDLLFEEIATRLKLPSADSVRKRYARILVGLRAGLDDA